MLIKDSFKRTKRHSRSSSQTPVVGTTTTSSSSPGAGEARFARLILQHQQQRLAMARTNNTNGPEPTTTTSSSERDVTVDRPLYRITRSRSPMDVDTSSDRETRPRIVYTVDARVPPVVEASSAREEDKEEEGIAEDRETGLDTGEVA